MQLMNAMLHLTSNPKLHFSKFLLEKKKNPLYLWDTAKRPHKVKTVGYFYPRGDIWSAQRYKITHSHTYTSTLVHLLLRLFARSRWKGNFPVFASHLDTSALTYCALSLSLRQKQR